jgi:Arc/MetJ-type ribon-helix-helix transcriptional regulator
MTIHLPQDVEHSIQATVCNGRFASVDEAMTEAARRLLRDIAQERATPTPARQPDAAQARKPIWEVAAELRKSVPVEEWDKLPVDGAEQHDHYIYGTPKRPPSP